MTVVFDLDDTLYAEMEFVRSAYRAIARRYGLHLLDPMMRASSPREAFDSTGLPIADQLKVYREHFPDIRLPWLSLYTLSMLRNRGHRLGLVTDGRSVTQRNKIRALGLERFIDPELIFISEEVGSDKLSGQAFGRIMALCGENDKYVYVGDNPHKDFVAGNRLGWLTVCLLDGAFGENLFDQSLSGLPIENLPRKIICGLTELLDFDGFAKL